MEKHANKVFVIGHRNPDSDSICSAIAYLKNAIDKNHLYVPAIAQALTQYEF